MLTAFDQKVGFSITHNHVTQSKRIDSKIPKSIVGRVLNLEDKSGAGGKL